MEYGLESIVLHCIGRSEKMRSPLPCEMCIFYTRSVSKMQQTREGCRDRLPQVSHSRLPRWRNHITRAHHWIMCVGSKSSTDNTIIDAQLCRVELSLLNRLCLSSLKICYQIEAIVICDCCFSFYITFGQPDSTADIASSQGEGCIIFIPLNMWCSDEEGELRQRALEAYARRKQVKSDKQVNYDW